MSGKQPSSMSIQTTKLTAENKLYTYLKGFKKNVE